MGLIYVKTDKMSTRKQEDDILFADEGAILTNICDYDKMKRWEK